MASGNLSRPLGAYVHLVVGTRGGGLDIFPVEAWYRPWIWAPYRGSIGYRVLDLYTPVQDSVGGLGSRLVWAVRAVGCKVGPRCLAVPLSVVLLAGHVAGLWTWSYWWCRAGCLT